MSRARRHSMLSDGTGHAFDLAPLIDVLFLLLVFFLVATTFERQRSALELQLPGAANATHQQPSDTLRVEISQEAIAANGNVVPLEELPALFSQAAADGRNTVLATDRLVPYERFVQVLDLTRAAGLEALTLEVEQSDRQ